MNEEIINAFFNAHNAFFSWLLQMNKTLIQQAEVFLTVFIISFVVLIIIAYKDRLNYKKFSKVIRSER